MLTRARGKMMLYKLPRDMISGKFNLVNGILIFPGLVSRVLELIEYRVNSFF